MNNHLQRRRKKGNSCWRQPPELNCMRLLSVIASAATQGHAFDGRCVPTPTIDGANKKCSWDYSDWTNLSRLGFIRPWPCLILDPMCVCWLGSKRLLGNWMKLPPRQRVTHGRILMNICISHKESSKESLLLLVRQRALPRTDTSVRCHMMQRQVPTLLLPTAEDYHSKAE